ncbi:Gypsy retrotransposon integrase-like protein 1 [Portunus trituberculatus]|uniref:RNA-directed DNA polymerase n=1 Tax=Portunus trituberculatus TaxID=210409 RepID=A0A5B7D9S8_PORTR|nr:Gypsy retrotransposon integrase-like protein 1 [Portunus trituberculatus]
MMRRGKEGTLHLRQIRHFMETGSYLPSVHITEKNSIRKSAKKFIIENSTLYYISKNQSEMRRVLYTNEEKNKAFEECHIIPKTGEHCGRTKTLKRLSEKYYWTNMMEDLVAMIVRCKACEFNKMNRPNQRFVRVTEPWEVVSIDIIGQFVASGCGNAFVAVIIDMFTKYTVVVPLHDTTVSDVTSALETAVFLQGPPRKFISDQCEEFVQEVRKSRTRRRCVTFILLHTSLA